MTVPAGYARDLTASARRRPPPSGLPADRDEVDARLRAVFLRAALARSRRRLPRQTV